MKDYLLYQVETSKAEVLLSSFCKVVFTIYNTCIQTSYQNIFHLSNSTFIKDGGWDGSFMSITFSKAKGRLLFNRLLIKI